jgi:DNA excision repair protein ERCC-4
MTTTKERVRIVADDREKAGGVIGVLRGRIDVAVEVRRLEVGDFLVEDLVIVERKTLRDFAASVIDARLFRQSAAMATGARRAVLILEGASTTAGALGLSRDALQGALITTGVFYGIAVLRTHDVAETGRVLVYLGRQARHFASGALPRPGGRPRGRRARQLFVLQGLPGVGPDRAARLLDHFGSIENVAKASAQELAALEGIGDATAKKIRWTVEAAANHEA